MNIRLHREATYQDAQAEAAKLGPQFKAAWPPVSGTATRCTCEMVV